MTISTTVIVETDCEKFARENPWLWQWTIFKMRVANVVWRVFKVHLDW